MGRHIKILYCTDLTAFQVFGGAEIQMTKTKEYIEKTSDQFYVKLFNIFEDRLDEYDIIHIFNLRSECLSICRLAEKKKLKIVLSPIWWPEPGKKYKSIIEIVGKMRVFFQNLIDYNYPTTKFLYPYKDFLEAAHIILPNSRLETEILSKRFKTNPGKFFVVPNAVDKQLLNVSPDLFVEKYGLEDFVLFVGRIEPRKNLLALLRAYEDIEIPLVIVGHPYPITPEYFNECKKAARNNHNVHFLGFIPPHSRELFSAYAAAKVFVLPSWFETPGLAALEAGLAGCNLVITNGGSTTEYFRDYALYVNPASLGDLKEKILIAWEKEKDNKLQKHIVENYTWEKAAERTLDAYRSILDNASTK